MGVPWVYKITALVLISLLVIYLMTPVQMVPPSLPLPKLTGPNQSSLPLLQSPTEVLPLLPGHYLSHYKNPCWRDSNDEFRCVPAVYLAGMPKCGSTDLYSKLTWHPQLVGMVSKENHYWARLRLGKSGNHLKKDKETPVPFTTYLGLMHSAAVQIEVDESRISIDGTQSLLWDMIDWEERYPDLAEPPFTNADLIHDVTPQAKVLVVLRNPVDRLYSDFLYFRAGRNAAMFHEAVVTEVTRFNTCLEANTLRTCCYDKDNDPEMRLNLGLYYCFVKDWHRLLDLHVVTLEEYSNQPLPVLLRLYNWLQLPQPNVKELQQHIKSSKRENANTAKEGMGKETRVLLQEFYRPYNKMLAKLLDDTRFLY